jgi:hypothetical protein
MGAVRKLGRTTGFLTKRPEEKGYWLTKSPGVGRVVSTQTNEPDRQRIAGGTQTKESRSGIETRVTNEASEMSSW